MAINIYTGLMGSGKSYEVVSSVIVPAVAAGRRVVTNIRGINNDLVRAYCVEKLQADPEKIGSVVSVTDDEVRSPEFFPTEHTNTDHEAKCLVLPGDLVCIDEAYKIWGSDCKIPNEHRVFFREHRHIQHSQTSVTCDLTLMTQDMGDLHRCLKVVVELSFRTHKAKGVGLDNVYTITMWEGYKQTQKTIVKDWTRTYNAEIFPLYKSYSGDGNGKETASDSRQNIFADKRQVAKLVFLLVAAALILWRLGVWWWNKAHPEAQNKPSEVVSSVSPGVVAASASKPSVGVSSDLRIAGEISVAGRRFVVLSGPSGVRLDDPLMYTGSGFSQTGSVDGQHVTRSSGAGVVVSATK